MTRLCDRRCKVPFGFRGSPRIVLCLLCTSRRLGVTLLLNRRLDTWYSSCHMLDDIQWSFRWKSHLLKKNWWCRCQGLNCNHLNILCRNCIVWEDFFSFLRLDFWVSLSSQREGASAAMRCEWFCRHHHLILHQNWTSLVCQLVPGSLHYCSAFEFQNEESRRHLRMRRTLVLLVLLMELFVACSLRCCFSEIMKCFPGWSGEWFLVKRVQVWFECQILTCDNDPWSVNLIVADYAVVSRYADEDHLFRWEVSALILKGTSIFFLCTVAKHP